MIRRSGNRFADKIMRQRKLPQSYAERQITDKSRLR
jgi:hypothetical protein